MDQLLSWVDGHEDEIVQLCRDLVSINTVNPYSGDLNPCGEAGGQEHLAPLLEGLGARVTLFDCPDDIYDRAGILGPKNRDFGNRPNLVAELAFAAGGPTIVINGHMDTVGIEGMPGDPLSAELKDGRIHGRGTSDCKGGLTVGLSAIRALLARDLPLQGKIIFESVVDEECNGGGAGTLACLEAGYRGDVAVFVDGNDDVLTLGCGGCLTADVFVEGKEGHAALGNGVSAIDKALVTKGAIDGFKARREALRPDCRVNLGIFHAGVHPAVIPGAARLSLNIVYAVEEAQESLAQSGVWGGPQIREQFAEAIVEAESQDSWLAEHPSRVEWVKDLIPYDQAEDDPWVQRFGEAYRQALGEAPRHGKMNAWSDATHPAALYHIPTVLYGPGVEGTAHSSEEYVTVDNLLRTTKVIACFLARALAP